MLIFVYIDTKSIKLTVMYVPIRRITPTSSMVNIVDLFNYVVAFNVRKV